MTMYKVKPKQKLMAIKVAALSGVFLISGPLFGAGTTYNATSPIHQSIQASAQCCAQGCPGSIGYAIKQAQQVHTTLASAGPNPESLFDISNDCFSGLSKLMDLSFAIPSLASILSAVQQALIDFAKKKVCTAINEATSMVTDPLNAAIADVNNITGFANGVGGTINGMTNGLVGGVIATLDPNLGSQYRSRATPGEYNISTNHYSGSQVSFPPPTNWVPTNGGGTGTGGTGGGGTGGTGGTGGNDGTGGVGGVGGTGGTGGTGGNAERIKKLTDELIPNAKALVDSTLYDLSLCNGSPGSVYGCTNYHDAVDKAKSDLAKLEGELAALKSADVSARIAYLRNTLIPGSYANLKQQEDDLNACYRSVGGRTNCNSEQQHLSDAQAYVDGYEAELAQLLLQQAQGGGVGMAQPNQVRVSPPTANPVIPQAKPNPDSGSLDGILNLFK